MMSWRYAVTRQHFENPDDPAGDDRYTIREVYFNKAGEIIAWSENPVAPFGDSLEELRDDLAMMTQDALNEPVFDLPVRTETTPEEQ